VLLLLATSGLSNLELTAKDTQQRSKAIYLPPEDLNMWSGLSHAFVSRFV
jgi:hypothetical protein